MHLQKRVQRKDYRIIASNITGVVIHERHVFPRKIPDKFNFFVESQKY